MNFAVYQSLERKDDENINALLFAYASLVSVMDKDAVNFKKTSHYMSSVYKDLLNSVNNIDKLIESVGDDNVAKAFLNESRIDNVEARSKSIDRKNAITHDHDEKMSSNKDKAESVLEALSKLGVNIKNRQAALTFHTSSNSYNMFASKGNNDTFDVDLFADAVEDIAKRHFSMKDTDEKSELALGVYADEDHVPRGGKINIAFNFNEKNIDKFDVFAQDMVTSLNEIHAQSMRDYFSENDGENFYYMREGKSLSESIEMYIKENQEEPFSFGGKTMNYYGELTKGRSLNDMVGKYGEGYSGMLDDLGPHFSIQGKTEMGRKFAPWYTETFGGLTGVGKAHDGYVKMETITAEIFAEENIDLEEKAERLMSFLSEDHISHSNEDGLTA